jgi:16S rRNA G527 N7-methylase RsmG
MKKQIANIFKNKSYLLDEPEVNELLEYCEHLQDENIELNLNKIKAKKRYS